jgi:enamine deaminase RidA (YjgF/YER057c/UK114 family)
MEQNQSRFGSLLEAARLQPPGAPRWPASGRLRTGGEERHRILLSAGAFLSISDRCRAGASRPGTGARRVLPCACRRRAQQPATGDEVMSSSKSRMKVSSGSPMEPVIGFSRAVRVGNIIAVSGTAPIKVGGGVATPGDLNGQTTRCLEIIQKAIEDAGGKLDDTIRTRIFLTDIKRWKEAADAHGKFFGDIRPACTFVETSGLIDPEWLVEIEADAVVEG